MAVNKKGGGVNSLDDNDDFGLSDIGRLAEQNEREPAAFREMRLRARNAKISISAINQLEQAEPGSSQLGIWAKELARARRTKAQLEPRMNLYKQSSQERLNAQAVNIIGREYSESSINSLVASGINDPQMQAAGMNMAATTSWTALQRQRSNLMQQAGGLRQESMSAASDYVAGRGVNSTSEKILQENAAKMKDLTQQFTVNAVATQQLRDQGLDPRSRQQDLSRAVGSAQHLLSQNQLESDVRNRQGLGALSANELKKREADAAQQLIKAFEQLSKSAGKTDEELEKLTKDAEAVAQNLQDIQDVRGLGGGKGGGDGIQKSIVISGAIAEAMRTISDTIQVTAISQPLMRVGNVAATAHIENEKYDMWRAAVGGDMTARMNLGGWQEAQAFGNTLADRTNYVHGTRMIANSAATVGGVLQATEAGAQTGLNPFSTAAGVSHTQQLAQGAQSALSGIGSNVVEGLDWLQQITKTQNRVAGIQTSMAATKELNHISGYQFQQYRDYAMGLNESAGALGGARGEGFLQNTAGGDFMDQMLKYGVSGQEMGALSMQGASTMGSMFGANQVLQAKRFENAGFGTAQENMARMGMLATGGTNDPAANLQKLIEEGMIRGLDSSKALNIIAENTGKVTEETTRAGSFIDPTDAISRVVMNALDRNNPNKEVAASVAYDTYRSEEQYRRNNTAGFSGQIAVARLQNDLGTNLRNAATINGISSTMLNSWRGLSKEDQIAQFAGRGVDVTNMAAFNNGSLFDVLGRDKSISEIERFGPGLATGATTNWNQVRNWLQSDKGNAQMYQRGSAKDLASMPEMVRQQRLRLAEAITRQNPDANTSAIIGNILASDFYGQVDAGTMTAGSGEDFGTARGQAQSEKNLGGRQRTRAAQMVFDKDSGLTGGSREGMTGITAVAESGRVAFAKAGENAEKTWSNAASKTASAFGQSATLLGGAAGKLDMVASKLSVNTDAFKKVMDMAERAFREYGNIAAEMKNVIQHPNTGSLNAIQRRAEEVHRIIDGGKH